MPVSSKHPVFAIGLSVVLLITNVLTLPYARFKPFVMVYPSDLSEPLRWYHLLTYSFYGGGLYNWVIYAFMIIVSGYVIKNELSARQMTVLLGCAAVGGGLAYMILHQADDFDPPMGTHGFVAWAFAVAALVRGVRAWKTLGWFGRAWVVAVAVALGYLPLGTNKLKTELLLVCAGVLVICVVMLRGRFAGDKD